VTYTTVLNCKSHHCRKIHTQQLLAVKAITAEKFILSQQRLTVKAMTAEKFIHNSV
jgi:hypothetical protein